MRYHPVLVKYFVTFPSNLSNYLECQSVEGSDQVTDVKSRLAFTASSGAIMEVVFEQHNPFPLGLGMKQMTAAAGLHERGSSECFLPTSDRLSSKSSQLSQNLPMQNSRSAARHRRRVNASLLFTSVVITLPEIMFHPEHTGGSDEN